eukprot:evm.model.scf_45.12 EVM.evm.TU.scf_45.12   scf_45:184237-188187(-)
MLSLSRALRSGWRGLHHPPPSPLALLHSVAGGEDREDRLSVGTTYRMEKKYELTEVQDFLNITGDNNPIHLDVDAAREQGFPLPVLPGMMGASLFPAIIGSAFPGAIYARQTLQFRLPIMVGEPIVAEVKIVHAGGRGVTFSTKLMRHDGNVAIDGTAVAVIDPVDRYP